MALLFGCEQETSGSLQPPGEIRGKAVLTDFNVQTNIRVALYREQALKEGTVKLTYGAMDANFVTLGKITYMVNWNDIEDFKNLKKGEEVSFRSAEYIAKEEKSGRVYRVINLHEM